MTDYPQQAGYAASASDSTSDPSGGWRKRWPRRVFGVGHEPDPRFTLANERTFLAWIRTSLALIAAGVAVDTFVPEISRALREAVGIVLIATGTVCTAGAYTRWMATERALRTGRSLPSPALAPVLACSIAGVGLILALFLLIRP